MFGGGLLEDNKAKVFCHVGWYTLIFTMRKKNQHIFFFSIIFPWLVFAFFFFFLFLFPTQEEFKA